MRRLAYLFLLAIVPLSAGAQAYGRIDFSLQNAQGQAISGATINVLAQSACGTTASGQAQLYSSATGGTLSQPLRTDGFGHASAYTLPGCVTIVYASPSTGTLTYPDQTVFSGTGAYCTISDCVALITPAQDLQSAITAAGTNGQLQLSCGVFNVASGLTIPNSGVHLRGPGRACGFINFTSVTGLSVSGANVEIDGLTFEGQTGPYSVQFTGTSTGFNLHDSAITQAGQGASTFPQTPLWIQSGADDGFVENVIIYGNGPLVGQPAGYTVLTDGLASGYVNRLHFIHNKIYGNNNGIAAALFDCNACVIDNPDIDQGNAFFTSAEGTGYGLMLYSQGYNTGTASLGRVSNTVTLIVPVMPALWPPTVGETMMVSGYGYGGNGTSFNGIVTLATVTGTGTGPYTMTWAQTAPDDTATGAALTGTIQPPIQHTILSNPHITNTAGACIYIQGLSDLSFAGGELSQCDLSVLPLSLPHSGVGINGLIGGAITGVHVDGVGHSSAFSLNHTYGLAFGTNTGKNANKNGLNLFDNYNLAASGNVFRNNTGGGIIGASGSAINCYKCSFSGNDIWLTGAGSGYAFQAGDQYDKVTGGAVHAPATGTATAGVFVLTGAEDISATGVEVDCYAEGSTVKTMSYGLRTAGTDTHFEGNSVKGCGVDGIFDAGTNTTAQANKVSSSVVGILSTGTTPNVLFNTLTGNTTPIITAGATNPVVLGNITVAGTLPIIRTSSLTFADGSSFTTGSLAAQNWVYGANANTNEIFNLNAAAGVQRLYGAQSAGIARWSWGADSGAESGSNAGSPYVVRAYDDTGTTIDVPITIVRAAGGAETHTRPVTAPTLTLNGSGCGAGTYAKADGTGCGAGGGGGGGVTAIDTQTGAFTFGGAGVSHVGNAYTFTGAGSGVTAINATSGSFTFTGAGVSCSTTTCTFSGAGSGVTSINSTSGVFTFNGALVSCTSTTCTFALPTTIGPETTILTNTEFSNGTCTTAKTIDPANGNRQNVTLTHADTCALTFTQPGSGTATVQLKVIQSAVSTFNGGISGCKWPGGAVPTITQTTGAIDMVSAYLDGTNAYCQIAQAFQ